MANPIVRVILSAVDNTTEGTKKALSGVQGFVMSAKGLLTGLAASAAGVALAKFFKDSVEEAQKAEVGIGRLRIAVTNAGGDFNALGPEIEGTVKQVQRLTTATDDDLRAALTNMITISGDVKGSLQNLSLVTDLAAFKSISLEDAATMVGKAMAGNVTAFNKMGVAGKDATTVLENARAQFGGFAAEEANTFQGALQRIANEWGEVQEAVGMAIIGSDQLRGGTNRVVDALVELEEWIVLNEDAITSFVDSIASAGSDVVGFLSDIGPWVERLERVMNAALKGVYATNAEIRQSTVDDTKRTDDEILKLFQAHVNKKTRELTRWQAAHDRTQEQATEKEKQEIAKRTKAEQEALDQFIEDTAARLELAQARVAQDREQKKAWDEMVDAVRHLNEQNDAYLAASGKLPQIKASWGAIAAEIKDNNQALADNAQQAAKVKEETEKAADEQERLTREAEEAAQQYQRLVGDTAAVGQSMIGAANAAGVMDDEMASVLSSIVDVGASLASMIGSGFSAGGFIGVINGIASIVGSVVGSHKQLQAALDSNRASLDRLSREVGNFNLGASGKTFAGTEKAIAAAQAAYDSLPAHLTAGARGKAARDVFRRELIKQGISVEDAEQLLKDLGFEGALDSDAAFGKSLGIVGQGLKDTEFGQFGQDFESRFRATQEGFDIRGTDKQGQFAALAKLAGEFSPALAAALAGGDLKGNLQGLFGQLETGGLTPGQFGDLSAPQFLDLIKALLSLLNEGVDTESLGTDAAGLFGGASKDTLKNLGIPDDVLALGRLALPTVPAAGAGTVAAAPESVTITIGDIHVTIPELTGDAAVDGQRIGNGIAAALETKMPDLTDALLQRAGVEYRRQRAAQGLT